MARRRDKYRELVWLLRLHTDPDESMALVAGHTPSNLETYIGLLAGGYGLCLEFEKNVDTFSLRCFARQQPGATSRPRICASYVGTNLARMLLVAAEDYREYMSDPTGATLSPFERVRQVA